MTVLPAAALLLCALAAAAFAVLWVRALRAEASLRERNAALEAAAAAAADRLTWFESNQAEQERKFKVLSGQALDDSRARLVSEAERIIRPLQERLETLDAQVRGLEAKREGAYAGLSEQIRALQQANAELSGRASALAQALSSTGARGRWGEFSLERLVELAGLTRHVDFDWQPAQGDQRPDLVVNLPNGGRLPVDAKVTLTDYLAAAAERDEARRAALLKSHAAALRRRVQELGRKEYWRQFDGSPEFVVMYVPIEASLGPAFEADPDLLEAAVGMRILIATPVTLLALLKTVAVGWQQRQAAENARRILDECRELYDRTLRFLRHYAALGEKLRAAVKAYNDALGSAEGRLLPAAERLREMGAGTEAVPALERVEDEPRAPRAVAADAAPPPAEG